MNQKIVTTLFWIGVISLLIAPLSLWYVNVEIFFPYITSKGFFWRFFIQIAFVAWAACALLSPKYWINWRHPFSLALGGFMAIILLANTLGHAPYISFWSSAERMDGYISLLYLAGWFIALIGLLRTRKNMERMLLYVLGLCVVIAVYGWTQGEGRVFSRLGNPIYLASLSFFGIFLSGYFMVGKEKFLDLPNQIKIVFFSILTLAFLYTIFRTGRVERETTSWLGTRKLHRGLCEALRCRGALQCRRLVRPSTQYFLGLVSVRRDHWTAGILCIICNSSISYLETIIV